MKTVLISLIAGLMVLPFFALSAEKSAKGKGEVESAKYTIFYDEAHGSFNMVYKTFSTRPVKVYIYNDQNELVHFEKINETGILSRPYIFKAMEPGSYTFRIVENNRVITQVVEYAPATAKASSKVSVSSLNDYKYCLSVIATNEPVRLKIFNGEDQLIFTETLRETGSYSKIYNLEKLLCNHCTFEVSVGEKVMFAKSFQQNSNQKQP